MIAVAKCRAGHICRYHGRRVNSPALMKRLRGIDYILACPETEAGLPIPRPPIRRHGKKMIMGDADITEKIFRHCSARSRELKNLGVTIFVGVSGSPCCDPQTGAFATALKKVGIKITLQL